MANSYYDGLQQELGQILASQPSLFALASNTSGYQTAIDMNTRATAIRNELAAAQASGAFQGDPQGDARLTALLQQFEQAHTEGNAANEARYGELLSGYQQRADTSGQAAGNIAGQYGQLASAQQGALGNVQQGYGQRATDIMGQFDTLGNQQRSDLAARYGQQRSSADQDLVSRGLGNTTIRSSVMAGLGSQENQDLARLNESLTGQRLGYQSQLTGDTLGAQERAAGVNYQAGLQGAQFGERAAGTAAGLAGDRLGVIERRTDTTPTLQDVANLSLNVGRSAADRSLLPLASSLYGQYSTAR